MQVRMQFCIYKFEHFRFYQIQHQHLSRRLQPKQKCSQFYPSKQINSMQFMNLQFQQCLNKKLRGSSSVSSLKLGSISGPVENPEIKRTSLDFNYVKPYFDFFQFRYNFMTKGPSNYMTRFCNFNLDIKSIRQKYGQTMTETDTQTYYLNSFLTEI